MALRYFNKNVNISKTMVLLQRVTIFAKIRTPIVGPRPPSEGPPKPPIQSVEPPVSYQAQCAW